VSEIEKKLKLKKRQFIRYCETEEDTSS